MAGDRHVKIKLDVTPSSGSFGGGGGRGRSLAINDPVNSFGNFFDKMSAQMQQTAAFRNILNNPSIIQRQARASVQADEQKSAFDSAMLKAITKEKYGNTIADALPAEKIKSGMEVLQDGLKPLMGGLKALGPAGFVAAAGIFAVNVAMDKAKQIWAGMVNLASKAMPAVGEKFHMAMEDMQAVLGRLFIPIVEKGTEVVRLFADFMSSILPTSGQMAEIFRELDPALESLREGLAAIAPIIRDLVVVQVKSMAFQLKLFALALTPLLDLAKAMNFGGGKLNDSTGAGQHNFAFHGLEEYAKAGNIAALRSGMTDPQVDMAKEMKSIGQRVAEIGAHIGAYMVSQGPLRAVQRV